VLDWAGTAFVARERLPSVFGFTSFSEWRQWSFTVAQRHVPMSDHLIVRAFLALYVDEFK
jgi:hypothetical protein